MDQQIFSGRYSSETVKPLWLRKIMTPQRIQKAFPKSTCRKKSAQGKTLNHG